MSKEYVEQKDGAYRVAGSRVSLDSIIYEFLNGRSPEGIQEDFPVLSLEQIYGAITYYLAHQDEVEAYLKQGDTEFERLQERTRRNTPTLTKKLEDARRSSVQS